MWCILGCSFRKIEHRLVRRVLGLFHRQLQGAPSFLSRPSPLQLALRNLLRRASTKSEQSSSGMRRMSSVLFRIPLRTWSRALPCLLEVLTEPMAYRLTAIAMAGVIKKTRTNQFSIFSRRQTLTNAKTVSFFTSGAGHTHFSSSLAMLAIATDLVQRESCNFIEARAALQMIANDLAWIDSELHRSETRT